MRLHFVATVTVYIYLGSSVVVFPRITDPAILEALACWDIRCFVVASDCKHVITDIEEGKERRGQPRKMENMVP
jgi:hypothetical protein